MRRCVVISLLLSGCAPPLGDVHIETHAIILAPGETTALQYIALSPDGRSVLYESPPGLVGYGGELPEGIAADWSTDAPAIAAVSPNGSVSAMADGMAGVRLHVAGREVTTKVWVRSDRTDGATFQGFSLFRAACVLTADGSPACWGSNWYGQLGIGFAERYFRAFAPVEANAPEPLTKLAVGLDHACGLGESGQVHCWGDNRARQLGSESVPTTPPDGSIRRVSSTHTFITLTAAGDYTAALSADGRSWWWGTNVAFAETPATVPTAFSTSLKMKTLSAGSGHLCGVAEDDRGYCWGANAAGELGSGDLNSSAVPKEVSGNLRWREISAGALHTCGIALDGTTYCWGDNRLGALGTGEDQDSLVPRPIATNERFTQIAAGVGATCALSGVGRAWCWGIDNRGQVGIGHGFAPGFETIVRAPRSVVSGLVFTSIKVGLERTCARAADGSVYCWGAGPVGDGRIHRLQSGITDASSTPLRVAAPVPGANVR